MTLFCLGQTGVTCLKHAILFCMSGAWKMDALHAVLIGAPPEGKTAITEWSRAYTQVRSVLGVQPRNGFQTALQVSVWPEQEAEVNLLGICSTALDTELAHAFFSSEVLRRRGVDASLENAQIWATEQWMRTPDGAVYEAAQAMEQRDDLLMMVCGSLCEPVGCACAGYLSEYLTEHRGMNQVTCVMQGPIYRQDDGAVAAKALENMPETLDALMVVGLPDDCRLPETEGSMADLAWAACADAVVEGLRGCGTLMTLADHPGWEWFGRRGEQIQSCTEQMMRAAVWMLCDFGPMALDMLDGRDRLQQLRLNWWKPYFGSIRNSNTTDFHIESDRMRSILTLCTEFIRLWKETVHTVPLIMLYARELQSLTEEAWKHYEQVLDIAGRVALLSYDVERTGIADENLVHRGSMKETEGEQARRFLEQAREHLDTVQEEQEILNQKIGGRALLNMLQRMGTACDTELEHVTEEYREAEARIQTAEACAAESDMERIDQAKSRLMRMKRHLALLRGRSRQVQKDEALARKSQKQRTPPEIEDNGTEQPVQAFFSEEFLDAVLRYARLDRKGRKDAMQELDMLWPEGHLLPEPEDLRGRTENLAGAVGLFQALIGAAGQKTR